MNEFLIDQPVSTRRGEELDLRALSQFLSENLEDFSGDVQIRQFPSGFSNLTYFVADNQGQEYVLRRPPFGADIRGGHDMGREFKILSSLKPIYHKIPRPILFCDDESIIGSHFYIMERVKGVMLRSHLPEDTEINPQKMKALSTAFIDNLAEIHQLNWEQTDLQSLAHPEGYVERQVVGWSKRYMNAKTDEISKMDFIMLWLEENRPSESGAALIHNDYKYDNLVLNVDNLSTIKAVLDWEMATIGDPLMDLGSSLAYWIEANDPDELQTLRFCLTHLPGNLNREELVDRYLSRQNLKADNLLFHYIYGIFKLAVIVQQIYARYAAGKTEDARFAELNHGVAALAMSGYRAIQRDSIA